MAVNKAHDEFYALDLENGWGVPAGYPAGIEQKILSGTLDERKRRGSRTRLLRIAPGVFTKEPFVHEPSTSHKDVGRQSGQFRRVSVNVVGRRPAGVYPHVVAVAPAQLLQGLCERREASVPFCIRSQIHEHANASHPFRLLGPRR